MGVGREGNEMSSEMSGRRGVPIMAGRDERGTKRGSVGTGAGVRE
jgi:hypothetical protein